MRSGKNSQPRRREPPLVAGGGLSSLGMSSDTGSEQEPGPVLRPTRALAAAIVPFLLAGFAILYLAPDRTGDLFAWTIRPRMTAMMLGASYLGGAYFFVRAAVARRWRQVEIGFLPVALFATALGISTIVHWSKFNHSHPAFWVWTALYLTTPVLVTAAWWANRRSSAGVGAIEPHLDRALRVALGVIGGVVLLVAVGLFAAPQAVGPAWPWALTPLTARVMASLFAVGGASLVGMAVDGRPDAIHVTLHSQVLSLAAIAAAIPFAWSGTRTDTVLPGLFAIAMVALLFGTAGLAWALRPQLSEQAAPA